MDVESLLRSADLPDVAVSAEDALRSTLLRGMKSKQRRRKVVASASVILVLIVGLVAAFVARHDAETALDLATGPNAEPAALSSEPEPGDPATWNIDRSNPPSSESSTFTALVTRLSCNNGSTGTVLRPGVVVTDTEVEVTFTVTSQGEGYFNCQGNGTVPYLVDLGQPIGNRILVDRACTDDGEAATTTFCTDSGGVRWRADGAGVLTGNFSASGQLVAVGGPPGAGPIPAMGTVQALDPSGTVVATAETDEFGGFQLAVPNGTYRVVGRSSSFFDGQVDCTAASELVVRDRWVDGITVTCLR